MDLGNMNHINGSIASSLIEPSSNSIEEIDIVIFILKHNKAVGLDSFIS
jgi:hypothetical protein